MGVSNPGYVAYTIYDLSVLSILIPRYFILNSFQAQHYEYDNYRQCGTAYW